MNVPLGVNIAIAQGQPYLEKLAIENQQRKLARIRIAMFVIAAVGAVLLLRKS